MMKHTKISSINRTQKGHTSFNKILVAAATCISEIGIEKTSVTAIAKKAEVSRALVAHYFPKKSELFAEVIKYIAQEAYTKIESTEENLTPQSALQKYANANFIFFLENPVFFKCFLLFYYYAAISKEFRKMNDKFNERAISRFEKELKKTRSPS
jgi:AcrR family transcriptional regulator